jgi:hypothetical protein
MGVWMMACKVRVIQAHRITANNHSITSRPELMHMSPRLVTSDPSAVTADGGNFAVQGHGVLKNSQRTLVENAMNKSFIELTASGFFNTHHNFNSSGS